MLFVIKQLKNTIFLKKKEFVLAGTGVCTTFHVPVIFTLYVLRLFPFLASEANTPKMERMEKITKPVRIAASRSG